MPEKLKLNENRETGSYAGSSKKKMDESENKNRE